MRRFLLAASIVAATAALTPSANAAPITDQLNTIVGTTLAPTAESFGTVTYTDHGKSVDVTIDLANNSWKVLSMTMNYDNARFPIAGGNNVWAVSGDASNLDVSEDGIKADGYSAGRFDIDVSHHGNLGGNADPYTFTIKLKKGSSDIDLDPTDFAFMDSSNKLFNAVHIGNLGGGYGSIWVGSGPASVPEPASLAVLGLGLAALGVVLRRKTI